MTSSLSGDARRGRSQHGGPEIHGRAGVAEQATSTGARPDLDSDEPDSPTELSKPSLFAVLKRAGQQFSQDRLTDLAAALTYYAVLSIVPGLIVLISILGLLG